MAKSSLQNTKQEKRSPAFWIAKIFIITIMISGFISFLSDRLMSVSGMLMAFFVLLIIITIGIIFDTIGVAVTSADERPFHSMAARKVKGAKEAISLLRSAERVSSICNDVIGDICGVVSGAASATIAAQVFTEFHTTSLQLTALALSALVAGVTVGGKAIGKIYAINSCTQIVHGVGVILYNWNRLVFWFRKKRD